MCVCVCVRVLLPEVKCRTVPVSRTNYTNVDSASSWAAKTKAIWKFTTFYSHYTLRRLCHQATPILAFPPPPPPLHTPHSFLHVNFAYNFRTTFGFSSCLLYANFPLTTYKWTWHLPRSAISPHSPHQHKEETTEENLPWLIALSRSRSPSASASSRICIIASINIRGY